MAHSIYKNWCIRIVDGPYKGMPIYDVMNIDPFYIQTELIDKEYYAPQIGGREKMKAMIEKHLTQLTDIDDYLTENE